MQIIKSLIFISLLFVVSNLSAQNKNEEQLAIQYYQNEEYEKAISLFEDLFKENQASLYYYNYYFNCLIQLNRIDDAEKLLKKLSRKFDQIPEYHIDLGYIYELQENDRKARRFYKNTIDNLQADEMLIEKTANAFLKRNKEEYAIETYLEGRELLKDKYIFGFTLASLYMNQGDNEKMLTEYLAILNDNPMAIESVQNFLQDHIQIEANYQVIKEGMIRAVQKSDYQIIYVDLLSWLYIQKKDFAGAFRQQKALDKRFKNQSQQLIKLADVCISNKAYDVAKDIYEYIMDKGKSTPYFYHAKFGLIDIKYLLLKSKSNPGIDEIQELEADYMDFISKNFYRYIHLSEKVILRLGEIKAIYLNKVGEAISFLNKYLEIPQISKETKAMMKLNLGDYYVLYGDVYEATLLYKQVDLMYRDHPLGHEAKYRNAKLSFYRGDFEWAASQLNVLKASTSELIANDALQLSLLIQDNLGLDTTEVPLGMYARADFFVFKNQFDSARMILDSIFRMYPNHSLSDESYFLKAKIASKKKDFETAVKFYETVYTDFSIDILADDAVYFAAIILEEKLEKPEVAKTLFEKIILDYPGSVYAVDARKRYRKLRESLEQIQPQP